LARSSSISKSVSCADIDMYNADMEYRFDWRAEREPSYEDMVFWRERAWEEDEDAVEAREGVCSITDMLTMESDTVYTGQSQGAGRESTRNLWNVCSRMLQDTGKASSLGSRRRLDNVSKDNRSRVCRRGSAAGRGAGGAA
jgi:hypothetical protein